MSLPNSLGKHDLGHDSTIPRTRYPVAVQVPRTSVKGYGRPPQYPIESVDNALRLLLLFETQPSIRLTEASRYLDVASSTAHRLLVMLQYRGFVRQNSRTKAYEPGQSLSSISFAVRRNIDLSELTRPTLEKLFESTQETVHLGELRGTDAYFLLAIESRQAVRVSSREGTSIPAHCSATGKAMLSCLNDEQVLHLYPVEELSTLTNESISTRTGLLENLNTIREAGYATSNEENADGVMSVAAPIVGLDGKLFAVNVSVPAHRMNPSLRSSLSHSVRQAAQEIASILV